MAELARKLTTVAEFLGWDDGTDRRYELIGGEIVMLSPPAPRHGVVAARLARAVGNRLRPPCEVVSEAGILLPWTANDYFQADMAVTCSPWARDPWCPDPVLFAEVLSDSTERKDRSVKLRAYRRLPSTFDILLVASDEAAVEHYARRGGAWDVRDLGPGDAIRLEGLGIEVPVDELYGGLALGAEEEAADG